MVEKTRKNMLKISKPLKHKITSEQLAPKVYDIVASVYCMKADFLKNQKVYLMEKFMVMK